MKTGALLKASCRLGAIASNADTTKLAAVTEFGRHLGLAFQIVDDLLDVEASTAELGKTAGKDAKQHKPTYVSLLGAEAARAWSLRLRAQALQAIDGIGSNAQRLRELADFVVCRKS